MTPLSFQYEDEDEDEDKDIYIIMDQKSSKGVQTSGLTLKYLKMTKRVWEAGSRALERWRTRKIGFDLT